MRAFATARDLAAAHPAAVLPCPVCAASLKAENLERHLAKVHPTAAGSAMERWPGKGALGVLPVSLELAGDRVVLRHMLGLARRTVTLPCTIEVGPLYGSRGDPTMSSYADEMNTAQDDVRTGRYLRLVGAHAITIGCKQSTQFTSHWNRAAYRDGGRRRSCDIWLPRAAMVAVEYGLAARGVLALVIVLVLAACGSSRAPAPTVQPPPPVAGAACRGASLLASPPDLAAPGPWPVGVRTVTVDELTVEVWYPARPGRERGVPRVRYDLRASMPAAEAAKIPDADAAWLDCDCARDLAVDDTHGPYPPIVFFHGAASFRAQSAFLATHWASRGFVVIAPDLPGIGLEAALGGTVSAPFGVPIRIVELVASPPDDDPLAFVRGQLGDQVALAGHSLGSLLAASVVDRPDVKVRIAMAGAATADDASSLLVLAGETDAIAPGARARDSFASLQRNGPSRLGVVRGAGHLAFSDLCTVGAERGGVIAIARAHGVTMPEILTTLATDGCRPTDAPFATTAPAIRAITAGVLEETLRCDPAATAALATLGSSHPLDVVTAK